MSATEELPSPLEGGASSVPSPKKKKKKKKPIASSKTKFIYPSQVPSPKELTDMLKLQKERRRPPNQGGNHCWLCTDGEVTTVYTTSSGEPTGFCTRCAAGILRHVVLPFVEASCIFKDHEGKMCAALSRVEEDEKAGRVYIPPMNSPDNDEFGEDTAWSCGKCGQSGVPGFSPRCPKCAFLKPEPPICSLCFRDYTHHKLCSYTKQVHDTWKCNKCQRINNGDMVECRVCRSEKTWFCSKCSMENPISVTECGACDLSATRLSSLGSFMRREVIKEMGLDVHEQQNQRADSLIVEENRLRLESRVEQLGMTLVPIADDGNCLFRAISQQLLRTDEWHLAIRFLTTDYLRVHFTEYIAYFVTPEEVAELQAVRNSLLTKRREVEEKLKTMTEEERAMVVLPDEVKDEEAAKQLADQPLLPDKPNKGFNDYVSALERSKEWGDEIAVSAACRAVGANIHVITSDVKKWHLSYRCFSARQLLLTYARPVHFGCVTLQVRDVVPPTVDVRKRLEELLDHQEREAIAEAERRRAIDEADAEEAARMAGEGKKKKKRAAEEEDASDAPFVGPLPQPLPERGVASNINIPIAKTPMYRMTTHDFDRFEYEAVVVKVHLGDSSISMGVSDRREVVASRYGHYFYIHFLRHEDVAASDTGRWTKVQRTVQWMKPFPLFILQRSDTGAFLTPSSVVDEVTFGSLQRPTKRSIVMTNGLQGDISNALMTCTPSEKAGTMFEARFVCEELECRELQFNDERIYTTTENKHRSPLMFLMPFRKAVMRFCLRCKTWYDEENPTKPGFHFGTSPSDKEEARASLATLYKNADQQLKKRALESSASFVTGHRPSLKYNAQLLATASPTEATEEVACNHINHADILDLD